MRFFEMLTLGIALLQREWCVSYRALMREFDLDEAYLEDLKIEIIKVKQLAVDQDGEILVWMGRTQPSGAPRVQEALPKVAAPLGARHAIHGAQCIPAWPLWRPWTR
jgi:hypothetical protein